jgi:hypothetical protein
MLASFCSANGNDLVYAPFYEWWMFFRLFQLRIKTVCSYFVDNVTFQ